MKLLLPLLFLCTLGYSQTTFKSLASEYFYNDLSSSVEWLERDIIISKENIVVKSYGKEGTDIQRWRIKSKAYADSKNNTFTIYHLELASGEENEYPATITLIYNSDGKVELITYEVPPESQMKLADGAAPIVRFLID